MKTSAFTILSVCLAAGLSSSATSKTPVSVEKAQTHCRVHQEKLKHDWVKIEYGLIHFEKGYSEARQKLFPFSNKTSLGGCLTHKHSPKFKEVDYCGKCRSAEWLWKREQTESKAAAKP
jgi:hypothetical protein